MKTVKFNISCVGLCADCDSAWLFEEVSTHSRPKAAGKQEYNALRRCSSFNSQPPEGGW